MRIASERQLAVMIVKGIDQFPENDDRLGGTIDIWWIVRILRLCQRVSLTVSLVLSVLMCVYDLLKLQLVIFNVLTLCFQASLFVHSFSLYLGLVFFGKVGLCSFICMLLSLSFNLFVCMFVSSHNCRAVCESVVTFSLCFSLCWYCNFMDLTNSAR